MRKFWESRKPDLLLGASLLLALLFMAGNAFQLKRTVTLLRTIARAPAAINLTLEENRRTLLRRCLPANPRGEWYLLNRFDLAPHIGPGNRLDLQLRLDGEPVPCHLERRADADLLQARWRGKSRLFIFARPAGGMKALARLLDDAPRLAAPAGGEKP